MSIVKPKEKNRQGLGNLPEYLPAYCGDFDDIVDQLNSIVDGTGNLEVNNLVVDGTFTANGEIVLGSSAADTLTVNATVVNFSGANALIFEGATADGFEAILSFTDPTADSTYTVPNVGTSSFVMTVGTQSIAGVKTFSDTTDASSSTAGGTILSGGLAVAKKLYVGTDTNLATVSGITTVGSTTPTTTSALGVFTVANATDSSSSTTGSTIVTGGLGVAKKLYVGTDTNLATVSGTTTIGATTAATISTTGLVTIPNATDATASSATASIQTSGGLAVAKKAYIGTQLNTQSLVKRPVTTTTVAAGSLITGAMMVTGYIEVTGTTNSSALDSAANITTALGTSPIGTTFDFYLNTMGATPMTAGNVLTITAGANMQFMKQISSGDSATAFLATVTATAGVHSGWFKVTFDTETTCSVQRIG